jgi:hypothetical protein
MCKFIWQILKSQLFDFNRKIIEFLIHNPILSQARLPIPPLGHTIIVYIGIGQISSGLISKHQ